MGLELVWLTYKEFDVILMFSLSNIVTVYSDLQAAVL